MFKSYLCGTNTAHENGFIHTTENAPYHILLHFKTAFFCWINGEKIIGKAGECLLLCRGDRIVHGPISGDSCFINDWIFFDTDEDISALPFRTLIKAEEPELITSEIDFILKEKADADGHSPRLISEAIYRLLSIVTRAHNAARQEESHELMRFKNARAKVLSHPGEDWTLKSMASLTGYSVSRFCAKYNEYFGISPMEELLQKRLSLSKKLLSLRVHKISEITSVCGFSSIHYFSRFFKSRTGVSPTRFRK